MEAIETLDLIETLALLEILEEKRQNNQLKIKITMSQKSNIRRAKYAAEQEKKAKKVIKGIIWTLVVLTAAFIVWSLTQV